MVDDIYIHTRRDRDVEEENKIDPDDGNSMVCNACRVPIFSTPFITTVDPDDHNNNNPDVIVHDQCANDHLPPRLEGRHPLHPGDDLVLHQHSTTTSSCSRCRSTCGSRFYKCRTNCGFQLDLVCALTIKILHRSHNHRLTTIRGKSLSSFICGACGSQHLGRAAAGASWLTVYVCSPCDYWIHPDCARLPNGIVLTNDNNKDEHHHPHPLLLTYSHFNYYGYCKICGRWYDGEFENSGVYVCFHCRYCAHIKCAVYADPDHHISFKPVLIREVHIPNLVRLPMPNEHTSVMKTILTNYAGDATSISNSIGDHTTTNTSSSITRASTSIDDHQRDGRKLFENDNIHEHPLIFHPNYAGVARVCNACVQLISQSDPFYSCADNNNNELANSFCVEFFLHSCCAHLPTILSTQHRYHDNGHPLSLLSKVNNRFSMFKCRGCQRQSNGFTYACVECNFYLDVVCAFMHTSITHNRHAKSHILYAPQYYFKQSMCICCGKKIRMNGEIGYDCNTCRNFNLHARCALLPDTITHRFDRHPLKLLITTQRLIDDGDQGKEEEEKIMFCEICEQDMVDDKRWYYGCKECDQYFHVDCIPALDRLSRIKFGFTSTARVTCHDCPLACVRALSVDGYRCGHCQVIIRESDIIAFECSNCYFWIHEDCARNLIK